MDFASRGDRRCRMRRFVVLVLGCAIGVLAPPAAQGDSGTSFRFRGITMGFPGTWHQRLTPRNDMNTVPAITVGNLRPGRFTYMLGHNDPRLRWPPGGVLISVIDWSGEQTAAMHFPRATLPLRMPPENVGTLEGIRPGHAFARVQARVRCKRIEIWVQFGRSLTTPETVARANALLGSLALAPGTCGVA
jgi:hypothetical protein